MDPTGTLQSRLRRRSQRISLAVPLFVSSLDPNIKFSERSETLVVSGHGCSIRAPRSLKPGTPVRLDILHSDRTTTAHVVRSEPAEPGGKLWEIALELDKAENFWGIQFPPEDWAGRAKEGQAPEAPAPAPAAPKVRQRPVATTPLGTAPASVKAPARPEAETPTPPTAPPQPQAAAPPTTPAAPAPSQAAAPPSLDQQARQLDLILREKVKALSAEFEESYRKSLGDLLMRLRADLEERTSRDWERLRNQAQEGLQAIAAQVRQQVEKELEGRRRDATDFAAKLRALHDLREEVVARLEVAGEIFQQQVAQERGQLLSQTREELQRLVSEVRQQVRKDWERHTKAAPGLQANLEQVRQARDYIESLIRHLPQTVDQRIEQGVAGTLEQIRTRMEEEFSTQREAQKEQLEQHLAGLAEQMGGDLRQKLFEDFDRHEREFLDRINVRLEEARSVEGSLRQYASKMSSELTRQSEQLLAQLRAQLDDQLTNRQQALTANLEQRSSQLNQRAESALRNLGEQTWNSVRHRLRADFDQRQQQLQQALETARAETARLNARAEKLAAKLDTGLEKRLEQAVANTVARARQELEQATKTVRESHLAAVQGQLEGTVVPLVNRSEAAAGDLRKLLDSVKETRTRLEAQTGEFRRQIEQARAWLTQETQQFEKLVHDALVEASGQIKGRIHLAIEMAQEPVDRRAREARTQLEELATRKTEELGQRLEEARQNLRAFQKEVEFSVDSLLQARLAEVLGRFQQQAEELGRKSTGQLQTTLNDALESISRVLRDKLGPSS